MYDELAKSLRQCAEGSCVGCKNDLVQIGCRGLLQHEAADAIEELSKRVDESIPKDDAEIIIEEVAKPRWIPVTERLPEKMQYVLVRYQNNDMAVASWFGGDEHIRFWRAMTDEGWCADCDSEPTHWMPLPEPPKEET